MSDFADTGLRVGINGSAALGATGALVFDVALVLQASEGHAGGASGQVWQAWVRCSSSSMMIVWASTWSDLVTAVRAAAVVALLELYAAVCEAFLSEN